MHTRSGGDHGILEQFIGLTWIQLVELLFELLKFLSSFGELAFGCQSLVIGQVFRGAGNDRIQIRSWLRSGCCASRRFGRSQGGA